MVSAARAGPGVSQALAILQVLSDCCPDEPGCEASSGWTGGLMGPRCPEVRRSFFEGCGAGRAAEEGRGTLGLQQVGVEAGQHLSPPQPPP